MIRKLKKSLLLLFGVLDIVLIVRFLPAEFQHIGNLSDAAFPTNVIFIARLLFLASLFVSAGGLLRTKKWGLITSYVQFPFRFIFIMLSLGFIAKLARIFDLQNLYNPLIYVSMILECVRLACSIWIHKTLKK